MSDPALRPRAPFRHDANPLAGRLAAHAPAFRPVLARGGDLLFAPAGAGAGGPVGDMLGRLREAFEGGAAALPAEPEDAGPAIEEQLAQARAEAFAAGQVEGRRTAEAAFGTRLATLDQLLARIDVARAVDPAEIEAALTDTALHLVEQVLEAVPAIARETIAARAATAAARLGERLRGATCKLNPADHAALAERAGWPAAIVAEPDPAVQPGGFALVSGDTTVDDRPSERLARAAAALLERG